MNIKQTIELTSALLFAATAHVYAQAPSGASGTTLITLGTAGGPVPRADRAQPSKR